MVLTYKGGSQKIVVPQNLLISELVDADRSALVAGAEVNLSATADAQGSQPSVSRSAGPCQTTLGLNRRQTVSSATRRHATVQFCYFSSSCFFSFVCAHSSASGGASFFSIIGFQTFASSAFT